MRVCASQWMVLRSGSVTVFLFSTPCLGNKEREGSSASRQRHLHLPDTCCRVARQTCERWLLCNRNMEQEIPIWTTLCSYPFSPPGTARSSSKLTQHSGQEALICHDMNHLVMSRSISGQSNYNNYVVYLIILGFSQKLILIYTNTVFRCIIRKSGTLIEKKKTIKTKLVSKSKYLLVYWLKICHKQVFSFLWLFSTAERGNNIYTHVNMHVIVSISVCKYF